MHAAKVNYSWNKSEQNIPYELEYKRHAYGNENKSRTAVFAYIYFDGGYAGDSFCLFKKS